MWRCHKGLLAHVNLFLCDDGPILGQRVFFQQQLIGFHLFSCWIFSMAVQAFLKDNASFCTVCHFSPYSAELFLYKRWRPIWNHHKCHILVSPFCYIWIPMLWVYGHYNLFNYFSAVIVFGRQNLTFSDVRFARVKSYFYGHLICYIVDILPTIFLSIFHWAVQHATFLLFTNSSF